MAALREMLGVGTTLSWNTVDLTGTLLTVAATGTFTPLLSLLNVGIPEQSSAEVETTNLTNTDKIKRFKKGFRDSGALDASAQYFDTEDSVLQAIDAVPLLWFKITYPDGSGDIFQGFTTKLGGKNERESIIERNITIKVSGPIYDVVAS